MDFDIVYVNTRIRAMKGRLFKHSDYEAALKSKDLQELATLLEHTGYRMSLESLKSHNREEIKKKLGENLITEFDRIRFLAPGNLKNIFDVLRERYDLENIKTIISLKIKGFKGDMWSELPFPPKDHKLVSKLVESDLDKIVKILIDRQYDLEEPYKLFKEKKIAQPMFVAIDKYYFEALWRALGRRNKAARNLVGEETDLLNLLNIIRAKEQGTKVAPLLLPNYKLDTEPVLKGKAPQDFLSVIKKTRPFNKFADKKLAEAEIEVKKYMLRKYRKAIESDPASVEVLLGYLRIKEQEIWNLMTICNSLQRLKKEEIEELIY